MRLQLVLAVMVTACADPTFPGTYEGKGGAPGMDFPPTWTLELATAMGDGVTTVSGTYTIQGIMIDGAGTVTGTFEDPALTLSLTATDTSECNYDVSATWDDERIKGTYMTKQCFVVASGNIDLEK